MLYMHFPIINIYSLLYSWNSLSRSSRDRCKISSYPKFNLGGVRD